MNGKKILSFLLALVMVFGVMPVSAMAAEPLDETMTAVPAAEENQQGLPDAVTAPKEVLQTAATDPELLKIVFVDAGRKYFSRENLLQLIDNAADAGFNAVSLGIGNDGLRFLLDDMSVGIYGSDDVAKAIQAGNRGYYDDPRGNYLTETEMDSIIAHAADRGVQIIPLLNTPGHMNAIVSAMGSLGIENAAFSHGWETSATTVNLDNQAAVDFTKELVQKYVTYFANHGSHYFNIGADEFANDLSNMGIKGLISQGKYDQLVSYVNSLNDMVKAAGMTSVAFNDGFYYGGQTDAAFASDIVICYWSAGWNNYNVAPVSLLAEKGHRLINTNVEFYWTLHSRVGVGDCTPEKAAQFNINQFPGGWIDEPAGAMFCIWCDTYDEMTDTAVIEKTAPVIAAFGNALPAEPAPQEPEVPQVREETLTLVQGDSVTVQQTGLPAPLEEKDYSDAIARIELGQPETVTLEGTTTYTRGSKLSSSEIKSMKLGESINVVIASRNNMLTGNLNRANVPAEGRAVEQQAVWTLTCVDSGSDKYQISRNGKNVGADYLGYVHYGQSGDGKDWIYDARTDGFYIAQLSKYYLTYDGGWTTTRSKVPLNLYRVQSETTEDATVYNQTVTVTGLEVGTTEILVGNVRYIIHVQAEDLSKVAPLMVEYWITNSRVEGTTTHQDRREIRAEEAAGEAGVEVSTLVDPKGVGNGGREFWQTRLLDKNKRNDSASGTEQQMTEGSDDDTESGEAFTKVRYYGKQWQVYTVSGEWKTVRSNHQLVAYYLEVVNIFDKTGKGELHVNASDWGYGGDQRNWNTDDAHCSISFQIIYESGSSNPSSTRPNPLAEKTIVFNWWQKRGVGTLIFDGQDRYEIDHIDSMLGMMSPSNSKSSGPISKFEWHDETTETVWSSDGVPQERVTIKNNTVRPNTSGLMRNLSWLNYREQDSTRFNENTNNNAILLQVYVKAKKTEDALTVHYLEGKTAGTPNEFYNFNIAVEEGTVFNQGFAKGSAKNTLVNNTVKNFSGETETVTADLKQLPLIDPLYRLSDFTLTEVRRSIDGKDVYLYYSFENQRKAFVADFGLPLTITGSDLGQNLEIRAVSGTRKYGSTRMDGNSFTYTPGKVMNGYESLLVSYTDNAEQTGDKLAVMQVYIVPASNVLYEEGFFRAESVSDSLVDWEGGSLGTARQSIANAAPYGYDTAYASSTGISEGTAYTALVSRTQSTETLTTSIYGNGFDLIGDSAPDTGMIFLSIKGDAVKKAIIIDTSHSVLSLNQVPLAHVELPLGNYEVSLFGGYRQAPVAAGTMSTFSADSGSAFEELVGQILDSEDFDEVSYVSASSGNAMTMAAAPMAAVSAQNGDTLVIDGFRVYRDSETEAYVPEERQVIYTNVLDSLKDGTFTAYVDHHNGVFTVENYESMGGPENEVYLAAGQSVVIKTVPGDQVQFSLRAAEGKQTTARIGTGSMIELNSATELYYKAEPSAEGYVTVTNRGENLLAIGNVKTQSSLLPMTEADYPAVFALLAAPIEPEKPEETEQFEPEMFEMDAKVRNFFGKKKVTLNVEASRDVSFITVNGERLDPDNLRQVNRKNSKKNPKFSFQLTVGRNETAVFEIVAYHADGTASKPYTVQR